MTRNAPADFPREIPNLAVGSWLARIGPPVRTHRRHRRDGAKLPPAARAWRRGRQFGVWDPQTWRWIARPGAGDEVIMSIAGHVSRAMLSRYSHVRMEAKRRA